LENLLVRASVVTKGQILGRSDFPELSFEEEEVREGFNGRENKELFKARGGKLLTLDEVEECYIRKILREYGDKTKGDLCEILGISRPTFERKLEKYNITFEKE
jgi:two-component system response regulator AtoC